MARWKAGGSVLTESRESSPGTVCLSSKVSTVIHPLFSPSVRKLSTFASPHTIPAEMTPTFVKAPLAAAYRANYPTNTCSKSMSWWKLNVTALCIRKEVQTSVYLIHHYGRRGQDFARRPSRNAWLYPRPFYGLFRGKTCFSILLPCPIHYECGSTRW